MLGWGTTSPDVKLQVNGRLRVDSSLLVKDSAVFEKRAHIKDRIIVDDDAIIKGKLVARDKLKVKGTAKFEGNVKLLNLNTVNSNDTTLLFLNQNGKVKSGGLINLINLIGENPQSKSTLTKLIYSATCIQGSVSPGGGEASKWVSTDTYIPVWANKVGVLWTGLPCPAKVGIGTDDPLANLHVEGTGYVSDFFGVGTTPNGDITFNLRSNAYPNIDYDKIAFQIDYQNAQPDPAHYGQKILVNNDAVKAIGIVNVTNNADVFRVYGDGKIWATGINIKNYTLFPDYVFDKDYRLMSFGDLRKFISQHHRLPKMPSAKEVQANGLELDQVVVKQQEKIEELTLYILQLEQRLSKLEKASK